MANSRSGETMIDRIVRVLDSFDSARTAQSASEISRRTGLPSSTAHRLVSDLTEAGLLERDDAGSVRIGMRLWELTTRGSSALRLRQTAMPFMDDVQRAVREHTQLAVCENDEALFIERLSDPDSGANITKVAGRLPLHASSSGLVLLAFGSYELQDRVLAAPLRAVSEETITDAVQLRRKLAEIRLQGYAFAPGYIESVSTGLAVPVMTPDKQAVAALSVVIPREQEEVANTVSILKKAARGISDSLAKNPSH